METSKLNVACSHCLTINRIPADRLIDGPVCGRCSHELLDGLAIELNDATFDFVTARTDLPVLVDFWAPWCGPCLAMAPQFEQASLALKGRAVFAKINSDINQITAQRFGIRSIPTLVLFQGGRETLRQTGALQTRELVAFASGES
jgi:thioredoxin 2